MVVAKKWLQQGRIKIEQLSSLNCNLSLAALPFLPYQSRAGKKELLPITKRVNYNSNQPSCTFYGLAVT